MRPHGLLRPAPYPGARRSRDPCLRSRRNRGGGAAGLHGPRRGPDLAGNGDDARQPFRHRPDLRRLVRRGLHRRRSRSADEPRGYAVRPPRQLYRPGPGSRTGACQGRHAPPSRDGRRGGARAGSRSRPAAGSAARGVPDQVGGSRRGPASGDAQRGARPGGSVRRARPPRAHRLGGYGAGDRAPVRRGPALPLGLANAHRSARRVAGCADPAAR